MAPSSSASRYWLTLLAGCMVAGWLAGCASTGIDSEGPRGMAPGSAKSPQFPVVLRNPVDPWAEVPPPSGYFEWGSWRSWRALLTANEELLTENPYSGRMASFEVMRVRNPSDFAIIRTIPETVLWEGQRTYAFGKQQVQWQKPPPPPPKPPAPQPPPPPPPSVLQKAPQQVSQTVYFAFSKWALSGEAKQTLDILPTDNVAMVNIEAHTDSIGSEAANDKLSAKRGKAVADYLVLRGIPVTSIAVVPKGESAPVADNKTAEGRAKNRRAEVVVTVQLRN